MPYNPETEQFFQAPATIVDSTPDGDTVQEGFDDRLTPAMAGVYTDLNLLKENGMIGVGIPATTTSRGIGRVATLADMEPGATINDGPAFLAAGVHTSVAAAAGKVPVADADGSLNSWAGARYAACSTAAATAAKAADLANFQLVKGSRVFVTFTNANTVAGALTLDVNGTGAKSIYNELGTISATNPATFPAGVPIEFIYDGTHWTYRKYQDEFAKIAGGAPMHTCRAWVNFNGTGTIAINKSGNVSSITDRGTGYYDVNFAVPMPHAFFVVSGTASKNDTNNDGNCNVAANGYSDGSGGVNDANTTSKTTIITKIGNQTTLVDCTVVAVSVIC